MKKFMQYFLTGLESYSHGETVGAEIETMFVDGKNKPISMAQSQEIFRLLAESGWRVRAVRNGLITELAKEKHRITYDLGRHNIELAVAPAREAGYIARVRELLLEIYGAGEGAGARPLFGPVLETADRDLLAIPDERDTIWLDLDGRDSLLLLAKTSAVQFTFDVTPERAVRALNELGQQSSVLLREYEQDSLWRQYIANSLAGYSADRYGGPLIFKDMQDYCTKLASFPVVCGPRLVRQEDLNDFDIQLFIRSVWWHFRLRRYGKRLCIEVRPLSRRTDDELQQQLDLALTLLK